MVCQSWVALVLWLLGYPDQALQHGPAAIALAQDLAHSYSLIYALNEVAIWSMASETSGSCCRRHSKVRARSSRRMVTPACFEAQLAKVHQLALASLMAEIARQSSWVGFRNVRVADHWIGEGDDASDIVHRGHAPSGGGIAGRGEGEWERRPWCRLHAG